MATNPIISAISANGVKYDIFYGMVNNANVSDQSPALYKEETVNVSGKYITPTSLVFDTAGSLTGNMTYGCCINNTNVLLNRCSQTEIGMGITDALPLVGQACFNTRVAAVGVGGTVKNFGNYYDLECNIPVIGSGSNSTGTWLKNRGVLMKISNTKNTPRMIGVCGFKGASIGMEGSESNAGIGLYSATANAAAICESLYSERGYCIPVSIISQYNAQGLYLLYNGPDLRPPISAISDSRTYYWSTRLYVHATWVEG